MTMPTSNLAVAPMVLWFVEEVPHARVLDVGPGWGKYATLLREYLSVKPERIDAVEAHEPYVDAHRLRSLYAEVFAADVRDLPDETLAGYDVVLMVDVIEHLPKPDAFALLDRIPGRVVVSTPVAFFQTDEGLPATEAHVSHWTLEDFGMAGRPLEAHVEMHGGHLLRWGPL